MREPTGNLNRLVVLALLTFLGGCAHIWTDVEGNRHVVGMMHMTLPPIQIQVAAETLRVRTLGLTWTQSDVGSALVLGYGDTTLGFLRNDVCVVSYRAHLETSK